MNHPPIFTYASDNPETPARIRYAAAMDQSGPGMHWICFGATREEARDKLRVVWLQAEGPNKTAAKREAKKAKTATADEPEFADIGDVL